MPIEFEEVVGQIETQARDALAETRQERTQAQNLDRRVRELLVREGWRAARLRAD